MYYFYNLSSVDARGELSSALTVLYYGNEIGAFSGAPKKTVDLESVFAVEIELTAYAACDTGKYSYSLVFFERNWNEEVWKEKLFERRNNLRAVTTKVQLTSAQTSTPTQKRHLFTSSNRHIDFADFPDLATSHCVPGEYVDLFNERFVGYLMRSERAFADMHDIFDKYQLTDVIDRKKDGNELHQQVSVLAYALNRKATTRVSRQNAIA